MTQLALVDAPSGMLEVVYYATDMCNIKIGRTISPHRRGGELRVDMLHTIPGGQLDERRHHKMWQRFRIARSEWFRPGDEILLWLAAQIDVGNMREHAILQRLIMETKRATAA